MKNKELTKKEYNRVSKMLKAYNNKFWGMMRFEKETT